MAPSRLLCFPGLGLGVDQLEQLLELLGELALDVRDLATGDDLTQQREDGLRPVGDVGSIDARRTRVVGLEFEVLVVEPLVDPFDEFVEVGRLAVFDLQEVAVDLQGERARDIRRSAFADTLAEGLEDGASCPDSLGLGPRVDTVLYLANEVCIFRWRARSLRSKQV
jgi:hypothetical protein